MDREFEEASVAGESPDKSEQRKSSGETTGSARDPRLGVARATEPAKAKVPAAAADKADKADKGEKADMAARPEADEAGASSGDRPADRATAVFRTVRPERDADGDGAEPEGAGSAAKNDKPVDADAKRKPADREAGSAGSKSAPKNGSSGTSGGDARLKAAVAAWVAGGDEDAEKAGEADEGAEKADKGAGKADKAESAAKDAPAGAEKAAKGDDAAKKPAAGGDKPTAVFKTVRPAAADKAEGKSGKDGKDGKDEKPAPKVDAAAGKPAADQPTAVFGAVRPKAESKPAVPADQPTELLKAPGPEVGEKKKPAVDRPTAAFGAVRPKAEGSDAEAESKPAVPADQPTELLKAPGPEVGEKKPAVDRPTAAFGAVRPKANGSGAKAESKAAAPTDQPTELLKAPTPPPAKPERPSQFVPLKKDDAPAAKPGAAKADAPAKPAAGKPAPAKPDAPAKPAIPVSVAPPQPPAAPAAGTGEPGRPAAPLDLLAQLTNTPPPPETPVRTAMRRVKIWTPLVALLVIVFVVVQAFRPLPEPKLALAGKKSYVFQGDKPVLPWPTEGQAIVDVDGLGRVGSYGDMKPLPIGSVAKVMTTYIILRDHPLKKGEDGPQIDVDQKAEDDFVNGDKENESVVEVHKGQKISEKEALEAVMLPSANNVARLLARWDAGSEEAFIKKMNDTAKDLGMTNTTYTDASGLMESTVSTAEDQVKVGKKAMQDPVFRDISKAINYNSTTTSGSSSREAYLKVQRNFNKLVPAFGVVGIKTGSTTKAGGNLLFAAEKKVGGSTQLIIGAVFGQHKTPIIDTATTYSKDLILATGKALTTSTVVKKGDVVGHVDDGLGGTTPVVAAKDLTVAGWPGLKVDLKLVANGKAVPHTAKAGAEIGYLAVGGGTGEIKVPVTLQKALAEPSFGAKVTRIS
ncbi:D-alanyl-D-alanine carboxypeptidase [Streptomyces cinnamoneus]|uniref:D-alanyl-D-alanine carboxypeptidase n=1 Tax=Streptomyces cinnamoneus TaxID=53446 RepID=UPI0037B39D9D